MSIKQAFHWSFCYSWFLKSDLILRIVLSFFLSLFKSETANMNNSKIDSFTADLQNPYIGLLKVLSLAKCEIKIKIQRIAWEILVIDNAMINEHGNARSRKTMENVWWIQTLSWLDFRLQLIWIWLVQIGSSMGAFKSQIMSVIYLIIPTNWNTIHSYPVQKAHDF